MALGVVLIVFGCVLLFGQAVPDDLEDHTSTVFTANIEDLHERRNRRLNAALSAPSAIWGQRLIALGSIVLMVGGIAWLGLRITTG